MTEDVPGRQLLSRNIDINIPTPTCLYHLQSKICKITSCITTHHTVARFQPWDALAEINVKSDRGTFIVVVFRHRLCVPCGVCVASL